MEKLSTKKSGLFADSLVIGFALFAIYFGAGNLIFPPHLGVRTGHLWFLSFVCYFITDMGLSIVAIIAAAKFNADVKELTSPIGKKAALALCTANIICLGPALAIPRTAATTFELGIAPLTNMSVDNTAARAIFSIIFFAVVFLLTIRPSKVVDIVGKVLTPVLLVSLVILIAQGLISPRGSISDPISQDVIKDGFYNGYQTLDLMGSMFFAVIIVNAARDKGYKDKKSSIRITCIASTLAAVLLFVIYAGLCYLGATTGTQWLGEVANGSMNQAGLLIAIINSLLGKPGMLLLAIVVTFACLTTAIGLTSATSEYFYETSHGKIKEIWSSTAICIISALVCNLGLSKIISFSAPILLLLYPLTVLLVLLSYLRKKITNRNAYILSSVVTLIISIMECLGSNFGFQNLLDITQSIPLAEYGFCWLIPAAIAFVVGMLIPTKHPLAIPEE